MLRAANIEEQVKDNLEKMATKWKKERCRKKIER